MRLGMKALAAAALSVLLVATGGTAFAGDGYPPPIGGGGNIGGGGTPPPPPPPTTGEPNPPTSGTPSGPSAPSGQHWVYGTVSLTPTQYTWGENVGLISDGGIHGACAPKAGPDGVPWYATGARYSYLADDQTNALVGSYTYECVFPAPPETYPVTCGVSLHGVITNPHGPSATRTMADKTSRTPWASDRSSVAKCKEPLTLNVTSAMNDLGAYLVQVTARTEPCTAVTWPNLPGKADEIVSCSAAESVTHSVKGGVWCGTSGVQWGFGPGSWAHDWTWTACTTSKSSPILCNTERKPVTLDGFNATAAKPVEELDSGSAHWLRFSPLRPSGVVSVSNVASALSVLKGSSPVRSGTPTRGNILDVEKNLASQPFTFDGPLSRSGDVTQWGVAWMAAGVAGEPFSLQRTSTFDARVKMSVVTIQQVNFDTMAVTTSTATKTVNATGLVCKSPVARVAVLRARNTN